MENELDRITKKPSNYPFTHVPNLTTEFHRWEMIMRWVESKLLKFPILSKIQIAKSFEKREIFVLKISTGRKNIAVFLLGGEEGRDWLTPAILLNFISYILEQKLHLEQLIKHYDFYILPILNPDGYEYSMAKVIDFTHVALLISFGCGKGNVNLTPFYRIITGHQIENCILQKKCVKEMNQLLV